MERMSTPDVRTAIGRRAAKAINGRLRQLATRCDLTEPVLNEMAGVNFLFGAWQAGHIFWMRKLYQRAET